MTPRRRWLSRLRRLLTAVVVVTLTQVLLLRWVNPFLTLTMVEVAWDHHSETGDWALPAQQSVPITLQGPFPRMAVAAEDAWFWHHSGFDWEALRQAFAHNRQRDEGEARRGGSTISQQVARNVFLWQGRSWARKLPETWYALWLELLVPKERILEVYGNVAELGPMTFGVKAAAERWYGVRPSALSQTQAARLAAILPNPRHRDPNSKDMKARGQRIVKNAVPFPGEEGFAEMQAAWAARRAGEE